jgi:hypothetical protein
MFWIKNLKRNWNLKLIRSNEIGDKGATKLGEVISKLVNLNSLNMNFA